MVAPCRVAMISAFSPVSAPHSILPWLLGARAASAADGAVLPVRQVLHEQPPLRGGPAGHAGASAPEGRPDSGPHQPAGEVQPGEGESSAGSKDAEEQSGRAQRAAGDADGDHPGQGRGHHEALPAAQRVRGQRILSHLHAQLSCGPPHSQGPAGTGPTESKSRAWAPVIGTRNPKPANSLSVDVTLELLASVS